MASFVIFETPADTPDPGRERTMIVRDGFAFFGFFIPVVWLLWRRLWIEAALALAAMVALGTLGEVSRFGIAATLLTLLLMIYVGIEGSALQIAALRRRGWREWGVIDATSADTAEARYLAAIASAPRDVRPLPIMPAPFRAPVAGPALGLFDYPGR